MVDALIIFEFQIKRGKKALKDGDFCIDASHYLCSHLKCQQDELGIILEKTSKEQIIEIAEYAYNYCDYMHNILRDYAGEMELAIAEDETLKLTEKTSENYDEIYEEILDELICRVKSVKIVIDGKKYKGK